jgi:hypothetical protein
MVTVRRTIHRSLFPGILLAAALANGQGPVGSGGPPGAPPLGATPKAVAPNAKPVRSCESLATVALSNTTIESASVDPKSPVICRVTAITTPAPASGKVRIWVGVPTSNWNGRFLGTGGGGFSGGNAAGVKQPVALGYASGASDTGHEGGTGSFAHDRRILTSGPGDRVAGHFLGSRTHV